MTIDPGASGDSYIQFDINATNECRIGVDDTDDSFRISQSSALGTSDSIIIDTDGHVSKPLQSAFLVYLASDDTISISSGGTGANLVLGSNTAVTEAFDVGGDFATDTYTAPVDGIYFFTRGWHMSSINSLIDNCIGNCSGRYSGAGFDIYAARASTNGDTSVSAATLRELDVSDNVQAVNTISSGTTGTVRSATVTGSTTRINYYGGFLIC